MLNGKYFLTYSMSRIPAFQRLKLKQLSKTLKGSILAAFCCLQSGVVSLELLQSFPSRELEQSPPPPHHLIPLNYLWTKKHPPSHRKCNQDIEERGASSPVFPCLAHHTVSASRHFLRVFQMDDHIHTITI